MLHSLIDKIDRHVWHASYQFRPLPTNVNNRQSFTAKTVWNMQNRTGLFCRFGSDWRWIFASDAITKYHQRFPT